ncbi:MAG: hypothetical protein RL748_2749, partial [Pseudomonadota bacterium]
MIYHFAILRFFRTALKMENRIDRIIIGIADIGQGDIFGVMPYLCMGFFQIARTRASQWRINILDFLYVLFQR